MEDLLVTIQIQTSKPDVLIRLAILDQEREMTSNTGKGHVVIPLFNFLTDAGELSGLRINWTASCLKYYRNIIIIT